MSSHASRRGSRIRSFYVGKDRKILWWWGVLIAYLIFVAEQCAFKGAQQMVHPFPLPLWMSNAIFSFLVALNLTGVGLYVRNMRTYHDRFNYQELFFRRGAIFMFIGGAMGYLVRVFAQEATITYATPIIAIGCFMLVYAVVGTPARQGAEDALVARLEEDRDASTG